MKQHGHRVRTLVFQFTTNVSVCVEFTELLDAVIVGVYVPGAVVYVRVIGPEPPPEPPPHAVIPTLRQRTEMTAPTTHKCRNRFRDRSTKMIGNVNRPNPAISNLERTIIAAVLVVSVETLTVKAPDPPDVIVRLEGETEQVAY